jgi:phospholipase/carboxylesterase
MNIISDASLTYLVREPKIKSSNPPVLFLLHGVGSNERDLFSFANQLPDKFLIISIRAPYPLGGDGYAWFEVDFSTGKPVYNKEHAEKSRLALLQFFKEIKKEHPYDDKQIYVCGFSQGAIMSYSLGLSHPDIIKGIAVMSGRILEETKLQIATKDQLKNLNVFISHGTNDQVLNIQYARDAVAYLRSIQINPNYKEYSEGHGINKEMLADLIQWLNAK